MNFVEFFKKNKNLLIFLISVFLCAFFFFSFNLKQERKTISVEVSIKGLLAPEVDKFVAKKIQEALFMVGEVKDVKSYSYDGFCVSYAEFFKGNKDIQPVFDRAKRKIEEIKKDLPNEAIITFNDEYDDIFSANFYLFGNDFEYFELYDWAKLLQSRLFNLPTSDKVQIFGAQKETVYLYYDNAKLLKYGLNAEFLSEILSGQNFIKSGGVVQNEGRDFSVFVPKKYDNLDDIKNTLIFKEKSGDIVKLADIVDIKKEYQSPPDEIVRYNGKKALILALKMKNGANIFSFKKEIKNEIKNFKNLFPHGLKLEYSYFNNKNTFVIFLKLPQGCAIEKTNETAKLVENYLEKLQNVKSYTTFVATPPPRFSLAFTPYATRANLAAIVVSVNFNLNLENTINKTKAFLEENFVDVTYNVQKPAAKAQKAPIEISLFGEDEAELTKISDEIKPKLTNLKGVKKAKDDWGMKTFKYKILFNMPTLLQFSISPKDVANALYSANSGTTVSNYYRNSTLIPIVLTDINSNRSDSAKNLEFLSIYSKKINSSVPISQVARVSGEFQHPKIIRKNGKLAICFSVYNKKGTSKKALIKRLLPILKEINYPSGYFYEIKQN